jgi:uncharacterized protein YggT (Ycf19 family)
MWPHCSAKRLAMGHSHLANWQLQIPSWILALVTYLLLARLLLALTFGAQGQGRLARAIARLTNPVVRAVGAITPRVVPDALIIACALFWVLTLRVVLVQLTAAMAMLRIPG